MGFDILTYNLVRKILAGKDKLDADRFKEPAFATMSLYSNGSWKSHVYNHYIQLIGTKEYSSSGYGSHYTVNSELAASFHSSAYSHSTTSSSANRGNGTSSVSHLGHNTIEVASNGEFAMHKNDKKSQRDVGTWVGNTTPNEVIFLEGDLAHIDSKNYKSINNMSSYKGAKATIANLNGQNKYGTISYNQTIKKLAIVESDGSYQHRVLVWTDVEPPSKFNTNAEFFGQLLSTNMITSGWFTGKPSSNSTEDNYRGSVVLCDNGTVILSKMIPSWGMYCIEFIEDGSGNYTIPTTTLWQQNWTTTYGMANGNQYGVRFQISNNGKYVISYCPSYYYGSGYYYTITEVASGKVLRKHLNDSSYGYTFAPIRDNDFIVGKSVNADGSAGVSIFTLSTLEAFSTETHGDEFNGGGAIELNIFENGYSSTDYPYIVPILDQDYSKFLGGN